MKTTTTETKAEPTVTGQQVIQGVNCTTLSNGNLIQHFPKAQVRIVKIKGDKHAALFYPTVNSLVARPYACVPLEIVNLAAGCDLWMRGILSKCNECGERHTVGDLEGGRYCQTCFEKFEQENEALNR